jgi:phosphoserine phosphatase
MQEFERLKDREGISGAREEMALWYRDVPRSELIASISRAQRAPGLSAGVSLLQDHGVVIGIASITWRFAASHFADDLGIEHCLATGLQDSGAIEHVWPEHKAQWLLDLAARLRVPIERTAAVGDSAGDHEMLGVAGVPIFVGAEAPSNTGWLHMPEASIDHVARHLVKLWSLQPNKPMQPTREAARG